MNLKHSPALSASAPPWVASACALPVVMLMTQCVYHWNVKESPSGYAVPAVPEWRLKKAGDEGKSLVKATVRPDPGSLYVLDCAARNHQPPGSFFMRFWPDGRMAKRSMMIPLCRPTAQDGDDIFAGCSVGYYTVTGDRITVEYFGREDNGSYFRETGTLSEKGILFDPLRHLGLKKPMFYKRMRLPPQAMKRQADW